MAGSGKGAEYGILIKGAEYRIYRQIKYNSNRQTAPDQREPSVTDVAAVDFFHQEEVLRLAAAAEKNQSILLGKR
jgi:Cu+-exporting ATPase